MKRVLRIFKKVTYGILISLFTIGISTIMTLNFKFIYSYSIGKYNLLEVGRVSREMLMKDFNTLISYLQNPFIDKLKLVSFPMSMNGEFHFYEVKKIFLYIYGMIIFIVLFFIGVFLYRKLKNKKIRIYKVLNYGANSLICIIGVLLTAILFDFSKAFVIFHKIFFNNDYWIFDEKTDPIISVLPEELFKLYALVIISLVVFFIVIYKFYYYKMNFRKIDNYNEKLKV